MVKAAAIYPPFTVFEGRLMTDFNTIADDPRWLVHGYDPAARAFTFVRVERARLSAPAFLADLAGEPGVETRRAPIDDIARAELAQAPLHFIFHTAFCRSTLLVRALEHKGIATGLSEPGIIARLGGAGPEPLTQALRLLARPWGTRTSDGTAEPVIVKPTNHANALIAQMLDARPAARAVLMSNSLPAFLSAVIRKGLLGRRWGRQLYLEVMSYAGMDFGMDAREQFAMTDLQAAALAWFLNQRYFAALAARYGERVRLLDGDALAQAPAATLCAVGGFFSLDIDEARAGQIVAGPVFGADAKTGVDYAEKAARDAQSTRSAVVEEEIAKVGEWIEMIARQAGLRLPLGTTLPGVAG